MIFAKEWNMTPFDVLQQDIDDFILIANYLVSLNGKTEEPKKSKDSFWDF